MHCCISTAREGWWATTSQKPQKPLQKASWAVFCHASRRPAVHPAPDRKLQPWLGQYSNASNVKPATKILGNKKLTSNCITRRSTVQHCAVSLQNRLTFSRCPPANEVGSVSSALQMGFNHSISPATAGFSRTKTRKHRNVTKKTRHHFSSSGRMPKCQSAQITSVNRQRLPLSLTWETVLHQKFVRNRHHHSQNQECWHYLGTWPNAWERPNWKYHQSKGSLHVRSESRRGGQYQNDQYALREMYSWEKHHHEEKTYTIALEPFHQVKCYAGFALVQKQNIERSKTRPVDYIWHREGHKRTNQILQRSL